MLNRAALALALVVSIIFLSSGAFAAVFSYRQEIAVENKNPSDMIDYQTNIILDTAALLADDKISLSCADVRFADSPSYNSVEWKNNFPFWVDENSCGTSTTSFWVKVDKIHAGGKKTIYVYYGSDSPEYGSSGEKTFDFYQDFDNQDLSKGKQPDFWTDEINGDASVIGYESYNGKYSMQIESDMRSGYYTAFRENIFPSVNFTLEAEVFPLVGAVLGIETDLHNPLVQFGGGCGSSISSENWGYYSSNRGWNTNSRFDNWNDAGSYAPDSWHNLKIIYRTNQHDMSSADFYLDSNAVAKNIVQPIGALDKLKVYGDVDCSDVDFGVGGYIDTIRVRKFSEVEPKVSVGKEEQIIVVQIPAYSAKLRDWYEHASEGDVHGYVRNDPKYFGPNYYTRSHDVFYYVITYPNGTQEILDQLDWDTGTATGSEIVQMPQREIYDQLHSYSSVSLPEKKFILNPYSNGRYKIELRQSEISAATVYNNPRQKFYADDMIEIWNSQFVTYFSYSENVYGSKSNGYLCYWENENGNETLFGTYNTRCGQPEVRGDQKCWNTGTSLYCLPKTARVEYVNETTLCKLPYGWVRGGSGWYSNGNDCWIEADQIKAVKVSDLSNLIWSTEFDVDFVPAAPPEEDFVNENVSSISPFVLAGGAGDEKNPSQNNSSSSSALPILAATAAGAAGLAVYTQRKSAKIILKNVKSGFTDFARGQVQKTKDFLAFLQWEKEGGWVKLWQKELEEKGRQTREKAFTEERKIAFAQKIEVDKKNGQVGWASSQANEAIEMLNSGKGDPGWFKQRMQYLAENSSNAELSAQLTGLASQVKEKGNLINAGADKNNFDVVKTYYQSLPEQPSQKSEGGFFSSIVGGIKSGLSWFGKNIVKPAANFISEKIIQPAVDFGKKIYHAATELPLIGGAVKFIGENILKPAINFSGNLAGSIGSAVGAAAGRVENIFQSAASAVDGSLNYVSEDFVPKNNLEKIQLDGGGIIQPAGDSRKIKNDSQLLTKTKEFFSQWRQDNKTNLEKQKEEEQRARDGRNLQRRMKRLKEGYAPNDAMDWKLFAQMRVEREEKVRIMEQKPMRFVVGNETWDVNSSYGKPPTLFGLQQSRTGTKEEFDEFGNGVGFGSLVDWMVGALVGAGKAIEDIKLWISDGRKTIFNKIQIFVKNNKENFRDWSDIFYTSAIGLLPLGLLDPPLLLGSAVLGAIGGGFQILSGSGEIASGNSSGYEDIGWGIFGILGVKGTGAFRKEVAEDILKKSGREALETLAKKYDEDIVRSVSEALSTSKQEITVQSFEKMANIAVALKKNGVSNKMIEKILSDTRFSDFVIKEGMMDAPFATDGSKLIISPKLVSGTREYLEFALEHEYQHILHPGPSEAEITAMVRKLGFGKATEKETIDIIWDRLIADYYALRVGPEMVRQWKIERSFLISDLRDISADPIWLVLTKDSDLEAFAINLAYAKTVSPDPTVLNQISLIVQNLQPHILEKYKLAIKLFDDVIKNA